MEVHQGNQSITIFCSWVYCHLLQLLLNFASRSIMIDQEIILLLHHIFLCLAPGYWYSMEDEDDCFPMVLATARLNEFQYETILLSSTI
jgi:hypothetical protein